MNVTEILRGLIAAAVMLSACSGKDDPNATATSTSKGGTGTTGDTQGTTTTGSTGVTMSGTRSTSASSSSTAPTDTTDPSETACDFLSCDSDPGDMEECDMLAQDCPEGEKCMPWADGGGSSWNATKCSPIDPDPKQPGEACVVEGSPVSGVDNCAKASMCWDVDPENEGVCIAFCEGTSVEDATCDPGFSCTLNADLSLILCLPDCDPLAQDCPGDELCIPADEKWNWTCVLDASGEAGVYGDPCEAPNACDRGLYCLAPEYVEGCEGVGCCSPFCDTSKANTCPGDTQECIPWYEEGMAPPGRENIGICGTPQ